MIEKHGITIIRTNPDAADFDMNKLINHIYTHIIKSTKKPTKKLLIDDLSKRLLVFEFKTNHSIKSKCLKWVVKLQKMKKYTIRNKTNKNWKKNLEQRIILGVKILHIILSHKK